MATPTILHVIPSLSTGGAERMLAGLVSAKRRERPVNSEVAVLRGGGDLEPLVRAAGVAVHDLGMAHWVQFPTALLRLITLIRGTEPVAIQSWLYYADLISLWALEGSGRRAGTRLYWGVRCSDMDQSQYRRSLRLAIAACVRRSARPNAVVANSFAGREAHLRLGYTPRAFPVIANGIDTGCFRPNASVRARVRSELGLDAATVVAIHVARVDPMKDHGSLIDVAAQLPYVRFVAVGRGTERLIGPPNLISLGQRNDLPPLYAASDFAISTSAFGEGFPNVIGEAMAAGLPVVATDVGDSRRIIGDTGSIVQPKDPAAMATAIHGFMSDAERHRLGVRSRERIEAHFSLEHAVAAFDRLHLDGAVPDDPAMTAE